MTLKNLLSVAVAAALMTSSAALAQPTIAIDLVRNEAGNPVLSEEGNFQFVVTATPGTIQDLDGEEDGDSLALNLGIEVTTGSLVGGTTQASIEAQEGGVLTNTSGDFTLDSDAFDTLIPSTVFFSFADPGVNPAVTPSGTGGAFPLGIVEGTEGPGTDLNAINVGIGSDELNAGTFDALFFETAGPSTAGSLTVAVEITSAFAAQAVDPANPGDPTSAVFNLVGGGSTLSFTGTATAGDTDLDGDIDGADLGAILSGFSPTPGSVVGGFTVGDFDGNGAVDGADLGAILSGFSPGAGSVPVPVTAVPEPAGLLIMLTAAAGMFARRSKRA